MGGKLYAFMDSFEMALLLRRALGTIMGTLSVIIMITDSKKLFDTVTYGKRAQDPQLSIYNTG